MKPSEIITMTLNGALSDDKDSLFSSLWERYRKIIYYYITSILHCSREDGEDLLQEIMMKVYNNLERYKAGHSFDAWIYAIARNHCLDFKRKENSRPCGEEYRDGADGEPDPFETVCGGELHLAVHGCLREMDDDDREMVYLRHFEGLRYKSIGNIIGMNVNSVKTRMRVIEARLRRELKEWL
jgi:RNA polymerase sigma factor (sigma-70 family)